MSKQERKAHRKGIGFMEGAGFVLPTGILQQDSSR